MSEDDPIVRTWPAIDTSKFDRDVVRRYREFALMVKQVEATLLPNKTREIGGIEITPEMIDAGEDAIWGGFSGGEIPADFSPREMAISVFLAMMRASRPS